MRLVRAILISAQMLDGAVASRCLDDNYFEKIEIANENNDYHFDLIEKISKETHLRRLLYLRNFYIRKN